MECSPLLPWIAPIVWILLGIAVGVTTILPTIETQGLLGLALHCTSNLLSLDTDFEAFAILVLFSWMMRDIWNICMWILAQLVDGTTPSPKPPPWPDPAPYLPHDHYGGGYGYAMSHYHFKEKSGHASTKHGGECEPITSRTMTYRLARTTFSTALFRPCGSWWLALYQP